MLPPSPFLRPRSILLTLALPVLAACGEKSPSGPLPNDGPGLAAAVSAAGGDNQSASPGTPVADSLIVRVTDAKGRAVAGAVVSWTVASGGGALSNSSSVTAASGQAKVQWTLGLSEGAQTVTAAVGALTPVTFTATGTVSVTGTGSVTSAGAILGLPDGTRVAFPPGAVTGAAQVTIAKVDPASVFDGSSETQRVLITATASVAEFAQDVEIRVPLPAGMTVADSANVFVGVVDTSGAVVAKTAQVRIIDQRPYLVARTRHFSNWVYEWLAGKVPPASAAALEVPYYNQGNSPNCWAAVLQMLTRYVKHEPLETVPAIIGQLAVDEQGMSNWEFRLSPSVAQVVKGRTGVRPTRKLWDYINVGNMKDELKRELGLNRRPVGLFMSADTHAVVLVGYTGDTFIVHDPRTTAEQIGYTPRTWQSLLAKMGLSDKFVTLVVPAPAGNVPARLSINFTPHAFNFLDPAPPIDMYVYRWDHTRSAGYSFRRSEIGYKTLIDPIPGDVDKFRTQGPIHLVNWSQSEATAASVWLDITAVGAPSGEGHYSRRHDLTIAPNRAGLFPFDTVQVDSFRYNKGTPVSYQATIRALVGGTLVDEQSLQFSMESVTPALTTLLPAAADTGAVVELSGGRLGYIPYHNKVTFNGKEAREVLLWQNDRVRVKVPPDARSGPVVLWRGQVPSNSLPFTLHEYQTAQSFDLGWGKATENVQVNANIYVEAASDGAGWRTVFEERSNFDPQQWVRLYFGTRAPPAGGAYTYRVTVAVKDFATTVHQGDLSFSRAYWVVRSQTPDGLPTTVVQGSTLDITEQASPYAKQAELFLVFEARNPQTGDIDYFEDSAGFGISFSPAHVGMR